MVTAMNGIEKHAAFYRAYLADDRSLASVAGVLVTVVAVWLLFYLVSLVGPQPGPYGPIPGRAAPYGYATTAPAFHRPDGTNAPR
jgi:hypothetical protein